MSWTVGNGILRSHLPCEVLGIVIIVKASAALLLPCVVTDSKNLKDTEGRQIQPGPTVLGPHRADVFLNPYLIFVSDAGGFALSLNQSQIRWAIVRHMFHSSEDTSCTPLFLLGTLPD